MSSGNPGQESQMPELTPEQSADFGVAAGHCPTCKSYIVKEFCGRHDIVYYTCRCPFEPDPQNSYHQDHSRCR